MSKINLKSKYGLLWLVFCLVFSVGVNAMDIDLNQYQWKNRILIVTAPNQGNEKSEIQIEDFNSYQDMTDERDLILLKNEGDHFEVRLVGKDGGLKNTWSDPVPMMDIFNIIDSMPMRAREMRGMNE